MESFIHIVAYIEQRLGEVLTDLEVSPASGDVRLEREGEGG